MIKYRLTVLVALSIVASGTLNFAHVVLIDSDVDARLTAWLLWAVSGFGAIGLYWAVAIPLLNNRNNRAYNPVSDLPKTSATTFNPEFQPPPLPDEQESSKKKAPKQPFLLGFINSLITTTEIAWRTKFSIEGRSTRGEYWRFQLVYFFNTNFSLVANQNTCPSHGLFARLTNLSNSISILPSSKTISRFKQEWLVAASVWNPLRHWRISSSVLVLFPWHQGLQQIRV